MSGDSPAGLRLQINIGWISAAPRRGVIRKTRIHPLYIWLDSLLSFEMLGGQTRLPLVDACPDHAHEFTRWSNRPDSN